MSTHPHMLLAYDAAGNVIAIKDHMLATDASGNVVGLLDFAAHEEGGGDHADIWIVDTHDPANPVKGSKVWPEWIGGAAQNFRVELTGPPGKKRISALIHKTSGHRRERAAIEAAIGAVEPDVAGAKDIRHLVGGPGRPLILDENGLTVGRSVDSGTPAHLPLIGGGHAGARPVQ
jgi:hypothetical protein